MYLTDPGNVQPGVTLDEFKAAVPSAVSDDDTGLTFLLSAAEDLVATAAAQPLTERAAEFIVHRGWDWRRWWFPVRPVKTLTGLATDDGAGGWTDRGTDGAWVELAWDQPQLVLSDDWAGIGADASLIRVQATVGRPDAQPPVRLKQAVILIAKEWYDAGIAVDPQDPPRLSFAASNLIRSVRYMRPDECRAA